MEENHAKKVMQLIDPDEEYLKHENLKAVDKNSSGLA